MNRAVAIVAALVVLCIGLWVAFGSTGRSGSGEIQEVKPSNSAEAFAVATRLLADGKAELAFDEIQRFRVGAQEGAFDRGWQDLEIAVLEKLDAYPQLLKLYQQTPGLFSEREGLTLKLARFLLQYRDWANVDRLVADWSTTGKQRTDWFFVQTDRYVGEQKVAEAVRLLSNQQYQGEDEIKRLLRLASLATNEELATAWDYLTKAHEIDPKNIDVRLLRGRLLEKVGKPMLAHVEFRGAMVTNPKNPVAREQLADFYRRQKEYRLALTTWGHGLKEDSSDSIWLSTLFWNKVAIPVVFDWSSAPVAEGPTAPLVKYLIGLKPGEFWNSGTYPPSPQMQVFTRLQQETFWLRLLSELQQGQEQRALDLLNSNSFAPISWAPRLEGALKQILSYRLTGKLPVSSAKDSAKEVEHVSYQQLDQVAALASDRPLEEVMPADLQRLLTGDEVFSAAFLAEGWHEAALSFHRLSVIPADYPIWVAYELVRAMDSNRTRADALAFIQKQQSNDLMQLLQSELLIGEKRGDEAVELLKPLTSREGAVGFRAGVVLTTYYVEAGKYPEAESVLARNPPLSGHLAGKELAARIAFLKGNAAEADRLYQAIAEESFIAQSYLARRAFDNREYEKAKEMTMRMIRAKPDMLELREGLNKIIEAEKAAQG